jgi:glycosyltransferase involved in cell wall biosynthesis
VNIWYVHPYAGGPGVGRFYRPWHLAREWKRLGHGTTVLTADYHHLLDRNEPLPPRTDVEGAAFVALPAGRYKGNGLDRILNMARFCKSLRATYLRVGKDLPKPDVIIVSSPHPFTVFPARALARRFGAKLVFEVRDLWPLSITEINGTSKWHPFVLLAGIAERYAYRHADLVASLLPGVENYIKERGLAYKAFAWVPNGVEADKGRVTDPPKSEEGRRIANLIEIWTRERRRIIIHPGAMGPPNGLDMLVEAVAALNSRGLGQAFAVLLLGGGVSRPQLEALSATRSLSNIAFGGPVPKAEAQYLIGLCDLGYTGGLNHARVYRYGISFNKIMDFASAGLRMVMPFDAYENPVKRFNLGDCARDSNPADIADAIERALTIPKSLNDQPGLSSFREKYDYAHIARNYLAALGSAHAKVNP